MPDTSSESVQIDLESLRRLANRHFRWMLYVGVFGAFTLFAAVALGSWLFVGIALLFGFLTWNKWQEWRRAQRWISDPLPQSDSDWTIWRRIFWHEIKNPPLWEKASNWIAYVLAAVLAIFVSVTVLTTTTSLLTRVGWIGAYLCAALVAAEHMSLRRQQAREHEERHTMLQQTWRDLT
jgi:hypothetical protein